MGAPLNYLPLIKDYDLITVTDGGKTLRHNDAGAVSAFDIVKNDVSSNATKESVFYTSVLENFVFCQGQSVNHDTRIKAVEYCNELIAIHERMKCPSARDYLMLSNLLLSLGVS